MRHRSRWLFLSILVVALWSIAPQQTPQTAAATAPLDVVQRDGVPIARWIHVAGPRDTVDDDTIALGPGSWIRTEELFSDFVLRADFRLLAPDTDACLGVRSWTEFVPDDLGYCFSLNGRPPQRAAGSIEARGVRIGDMAFHPPAVAAPLGAWQSFEIVVNRDSMRGSLNGAHVTTATGLDEFTGYITVRTRRGRIELRNISTRLLGMAEGAFGSGAYRTSDPGIQAPRAVKTTKPRYPLAQHNAWKQGTVAVELVVEPNGLPGDARIVQSLHPSLNAAAIACVRQWRFRSALKEGKPVAVIVTVDISFTRTQ